MSGPPALAAPAHGLATAGAPVLAAAGGQALDSPLVAVIVLAALTVVSFAIVMLTSFVKIAVVLSVLRSALGTPQIPPTLVITGLAFVLSAFIMSPVAYRMADRAKPGLEKLEQKNLTPREQVGALVAVGTDAAQPLKQFLKRHAHARDRAMFLRLAQRLHGPTRRAEIKSDDFLVIIPAFLTSELQEAFQIGFFIFVPFLVIDLVVANILLALGMHMLSPTTISLPFKFLLFVLIEGWALLTRGLIAGYL